MPEQTALTESESNGVVARVHAPIEAEEGAEEERAEEERAVEVMAAMGSVAAETVVAGREAAATVAAGWAVEVTEREKRRD